MYKYCQIIFINNFFKFILISKISLLLKSFRMKKKEKRKNMKERVLCLS